MLVLTRKPNQQVRIGNDIVITVVKVKGNTIRLGIEAPRDVRVLRCELDPIEKSAEDKSHSNSISNNNHNTVDGEQYHCDAEDQLLETNKRTSAKRTMHRETPIASDSDNGPLKSFTKARSEMRGLSARTQNRQLNNSPLNSRNSSVEDGPMCHDNLTMHRVRVETPVSFRF